MGIKWKLIIGLVLALSLGLWLPAQAYAHGAKIEYTVGMTVEIVATYDSGEPMAGAQVTIYAPDDPSTPWLTGVCDDEGTWDVQVRQAGHGDIVHIPIGVASAGNGGGGNTPLQIVLMAVCVVWGSIGIYPFP